MTAEELRAIIAYLRDRVHLRAPAGGEPVCIHFDGPTKKEMVGAGLNAEGSEQVLCAPWWEEMVADIIETPEFCDPGDSSQQVLEYAKDVVTDYVRKRFPFDGK